MRRYRTIVADPPWNVKRGTLRGREGWHDAAGPARALAYPTMSVAEIAALPVRELAEPDAHLYLWTVNRYVDEAFDVARAWGFKFSTLLTWRKTPMGGGLGGAFGITTEHVLFCRRGKLPAKSKVVGTCFDYKRPYDTRGKPRQGAKPPEFIVKRVEAVSPGPYLEMFSRAEVPREGWSYWGDQSLGTAQMPGAA